MSRREQKTAIARQKRQRHELEQAANPTRSSARMDVQPPAISTHYNRTTIRTGAPSKRPRVVYNVAHLAERFRRPVHWDGEEVHGAMDVDGERPPTQPMPAPVRRIVDLFWAGRDQRLADEETMDTFLPPNLQEAAEAAAGERAQSSVRVLCVAQRTNGRMD